MWDKYDKYDGLVSGESLRTERDKKGGWIMLIHTEVKGAPFNKVAGGGADFLHAEGNLNGNWFIYLVGPIRSCT